VATLFGNFSRGDPGLKEEIRKEILTEELLELPARFEAAEEARRKDIEAILHLLHELALSQKQTQENLAQLTVRVDQTQQQLAQLAIRVEQVEQQLAQLAQRVDQLTEQLDRLVAKTEIHAVKLGELDGHLIEFSVQRKLSR
jgi:methyl-accepting chemotaxis protein